MGAAGRALGATAGRRCTLHIVRACRVRLDVEDVREHRDGLSHRTRSHVHAAAAAGNAGEE